LSASEFKHIVRIAGKDIDGSRKITVALSAVKGIGHNLAQVLLQSIKINPNIRLGFLTEKELIEVESAIRDPARAGLPDWYLNRRKDMETGTTRHLITSDLDFMISNDIEREKSVMSWRGYRHMFGLRVRGQCTRTTGRKGGAVGVKRLARPVSTGPAGAPSSVSSGTLPAVPSQATTKAKESPANESENK
jgi:small subunit ribosomal protein S13